MGSAKWVEGADLRANQRRSAFVNDKGESAFCCECGADGEWSCNRCGMDVCRTHVAFIYHDCANPPHPLQGA